MAGNRKKNIHKLNNEGSAIVTVIVVVAFISILATTILYLSGMNFFMKATDLKTKKSFYTAETALEEVKAELTAEVAKASEEAYTYVMINYASTDGYSRYTLFQDKFFEVLTENWEAKRVIPPVATPVSYEEMLKAMVDAEYRGGLTLRTGDIPDAGSIDLTHQSDGYALMKGVRVEYAEDGFTTIISTDFMITVPEFNWGVDVAQTTWAADDDAEKKAEKLTRDSVDIMKCVAYCNYVKQ